MASDQVNNAETNSEAALLAATECSVTQRQVLLWQRPTIPDVDIPEAVCIAHSSWAEIKKRGEGPPLFEIGRRVFCRTDDLREWLFAKAAAGKPGNKKLRRASEAAQ